MELISDLTENSPLSYFKMSDILALTMKVHIYWVPLPTQLYFFLSIFKQKNKKNRKVQEEPQSEVAANPRHQEEEKKWHRLTCA